MALVGGARLGPYQILGGLGAGGMGEVYRARDTRLGREVAIKVLPAERMADPARRARFEKEARAVAALNHPSIVTLHDIDSAGGIDFLVLELVPGKTLDAVIPRQGMRLGEALRVAIPIADALIAAHAAGIVHRDLKPANVMVTPEGVVKVLDFGLAKLTHDQPAGAGGGTETLGESAPLSQHTLLAGSAGYMSPEQASGGKVDARSDVFAFGVLLYEMVTGRRAFPGQSSAEAIAAVLRDQPKPPGELVPDVPKELERVIVRSLRKEPERRFQHMTDLRVELQEVKEETDSQAKAPRELAKRGSRHRSVAWAVAGLLVLGAVAGLTLRRLRGGGGPAPRVVPLGSLRNYSYGTFSPDGTQIAFSSPGESGTVSHIWLKIVGEAETRLLTTGPAVDLSPAWSPDGKQIAFTRFPQNGEPPGMTYLTSPLGGPERRLSDFPVRGGLCWSPDGRWLAVTKARVEGDATPGSGGIHLVPIAGGDPRPLTLPNPPIVDRFPAFSPDGRALAYGSCEIVGAGQTACDLHVLALDSALRPAATPRTLTPQRVWLAGLAWTRGGGSIVYGVVLDHMFRVRADGSSLPERVELARRGATGPFTAVSRDRLGFVQDTRDHDIYRLQLKTAAQTPLLASTVLDYQPQYSPDGRRIAFESFREGYANAVWLANADGSNPTRLTRGPGPYQGSPRWSPDGSTLSFDAQAEDRHWDVWTIRVDGSGLRQMTHRPGDHGPSSWSRDGRWIYFTSDRTGRREVWRVAADGTSEEQITRRGGYLPFESWDGRTLFYKRAENADCPLLATPTAGGEERTVVECVPHWSYAVGPEGVFHLDCVPPGVTALHRDLRYWDARTGFDRVVAVLDTGDSPSWGMSASPDGQTVLFTRYSGGAELVMIEDFR